MLKDIGDLFLNIRRKNVIIINNNKQYRRV